jgi:ProP effector
MKQDPNVVLAHLVERFPATFVLEKYRPHRPLKVGIIPDIRERCPEFKSRLLALTLHLYTGRLMYLQGTVAGAARIDLDGNPAGEVTTEEAKHAASRLADVLAQRAAVVAALAAERKGRSTGAGKPTLPPRSSPIEAAPRPAPARRAEPASREIVPIRSATKLSLREKPVLRLPAFRKAAG